MPAPLDQTRPPVMVIGAGLAGLSAGLTLLEAGVPVILWEAAPVPGGRCGGWSQAGQWQDRGTHLLLRGNHCLTDLIDRHGCWDDWHVLPPRYDFIDLTGPQECYWRIDMQGWLPGWLLDRHRRVAGVSLWRHLRAFAALENRRHQTVGAAVDPSSVIGRRLIAPLAKAILNTAPDQASLRLFRRTLHRSLYRGRVASSPLLCRRSLHQDLIAPLAAALRQKGGELRTAAAISALISSGGRLTGLRLHDGSVQPCLPDQPVLVATGNRHAHRLLPEVVPALPHAPIVNAHFPLPSPAAPQPPPRLTGLCGGLADWILRRSSGVAVTVSAADDLLAIPSQALLAGLWAEVRRLYPDLPTDCPPTARLIIEKQATLRQTPMVDAARPACGPCFPAGLDHPLWLAGDWTQTNLPCTLEGAAQSGRMAARQILRYRRQH